MDTGGENGNDKGQASSGGTWIRADGDAGGRPHGLWLIRRIGIDHYDCSGGAAEHNDYLNPPGPRAQSRVTGRK